MLKHVLPWDHYRSRTINHTPINGHLGYMERTRALVVCLDKWILQALFYQKTYDLHNPLNTSQQEHTFRVDFPVVVTGKSLKKPIFVVAFDLRLTISARKNSVVK